MKLRAYTETTVNGYLIKTYNDNNESILKTSKGIVLAFFDTFKEAEKIALA